MCDLCHAKNKTVLICGIAANKGIWCAQHKIGWVHTLKNSPKFFFSEVLYAKAWQFNEALHKRQNKKTIERMWLKSLKFLPHVQKTNPGLCGSVLKSLKLQGKQWRTKLIFSLEEITKKKKKK